MSKQITSDQRWDLTKHFGDWLGGNVTQARADRVVQNHDLLEQALQQVFNPIEEKKKISARWIEQILRAENRAHQNFFGQTFDLQVFRESLEKCGKKKVEAWRKRGREVHFLPDVVFAQEINFPGWKIKPEKWYWEQLAAGKVFIRNEKNELVVMGQARLPGRVVLVDTRLKPSYKDGKQIYENDDLGELIEGLRKQGKLAKYEYDSQASRFGISAANEWESHLKPAVSRELGIPHRLEAVMEANVIPQLYLHMPRKDDGKTNTWEWREEYFEDASFRLDGGNSVSGGLASVNWNDCVVHWFNRSFRPLGVVS